MNSVIDSALARSRTILATLLLVLVSGTVAYVEIPKESDPDISIPIIYVRLSFDGISPEDSERLLIRPMEAELRVIEGLKEMRSSGYEGGASVVLEFEAGFDADAAMDEVREQVDLAKPELPDGADEPTVHEVNLSLFPVLVVILSGDVPERTLLRLARELRDAVEGISSVLAAEIAGDREDLVEVIVDPVRIESYGLSAVEAIAAVRNNNLVVAAGTQDTGRGRFSIKVPGLFEAVEDILDMPLVVRGDAVVTVRDIAEVRSAFVDAKGFARAEGRPAVALEVSKRAGENIIGTIARVRAVVEAERAAWPDLLRQAVAVSYSQDKSDDIRMMLGNLRNNVISAVLLVMIVVVAALGWRTGALVGIAIPGSFLTGILVLAALGLTINIVVLFSLILAVGMLVDGAIVVTEYADRKMCEGEPRATAYALAAKRMAWPITASTATTLAAFMPLLFWPGVVGEFMKFLPVTLLATLSASLLMALIFIPTLGAQIGRPGTTDPNSMRALAVAESGALGDLGGATGAYVRGLGFLLRHPAKVMTFAFALLVGVQWFYAAHGNGIEFFPDVEPDFAKIAGSRARQPLGPCFSSGPREDPPPGAMERACRRPPESRCRPRFATAHRLFRRPLERTACLPSARLHDAGREAAERPRERCPMPRRRLFAGRAPTPPGGFAAEADFAREFASLLGVVGRHHGIVGRQPPFGAVLLRGQVVGGAQVALQHLQLLPVLEANDEVRRHRPADGDLRLLRRGGGCGPGAVQPVQRTDDRGDDLGNSRARNLVAAEVGRNNVDGHAHDVLAPYHFSRDSPDGTFPAR